MSIMQFLVSYQLTYIVGSYHYIYNKLILAYVLACLIYESNPSNRFGTYLQMKVA